jgi:hypothetical protein
VNSAETRNKVLNTWGKIKALHNAIGLGRRIDLAPAATIWQVAIFVAGRYRSPRADAIDPNR